MIDKLIQPYFDLEVVVSSNTNHKSKLIEWAQREGKDVRFELVTAKPTGSNNKEFAIQVFVNDEAYGLGHGFNKKKAEQSAAEKTCATLEI